MMNVYMYKGLMKIKNASINISLNHNYFKI